MRHRTWCWSPPGCTRAAGRSRTCAWLAPLLILSLGGIAVLTGKASKPPGIVLAWDLTRTTYDIRDGRAVSSGAVVVRKDVADPLLRKEMPGLFDGSLFADCS